MEDAEANAGTLFQEVPLLKTYVSWQMAQLLRQL